MLRKILGAIVVIIIVIWVLSDPAAAGDDVHNWTASLIAFATHAGKG